MNTELNLSDWIKKQALDCGFVACGISQAQPLIFQKEIFHKWLLEGRNAGMLYLGNNLEKRMDPTLLQEGSSSVISLIYSYYSGKEQNPASFFKIAKFARSKDYHIVLKEKLTDLTRKIESRTGAFKYRLFADSAPVSEKSWAVKSGLGWIGKNSLMINKNFGSFIFICEIICDIKLKPDTELYGDHCGNCTICIDCCPTGAIYEEGRIDASLCIAYHTIEHKEEIPKHVKSSLNGNIYGCDICQDVCPFNRNLAPVTGNWFEPKPEILEMVKTDWLRLEKKHFTVLFNETSLSRLTYEGLMNKIKSVPE